MNEYRGRHTSPIPWTSASGSGSRYRSRHERRDLRRRRIIIGIAALVLLVLMYPFLDAMFIRVDRVSVQSEDLPADIGHLRIVYLSDVHYGFFFPDSRVRSLVNQINALKPDIVIFGGDMGDDPAYAISFFQNLPSVHARYTMLGVLGEHDRGKDDLERSLVTDAMRGAGITPVIQNVIPVRVGTSIIYAAGLDDGSNASADIRSLAASVSAEDFVVFLNHNPSVIPDAQRAADRNGRLGWFDLALFGHTHGGQLMGLGSLLGIGSDVDDRYRGGLLTENRSSLLISNGVGTSVIPARLFAPAQIHCIDVSRP